MELPRAAIKKTLLYSDLFEYPLKKEEIWRYLISSNKVSFKTFEKLLKDTASLHRLGKYYFINKRRSIVLARLRREKISTKKIIYAKKIAKQLSFIPTVMLIGISGSLSMKNSEETDDIDLFVVSSKNTVWITRLLIIFFLITKGKYRKRNDKNTAGKFCLNMVMDENNLALQRDRQDLYTAHEVSQMLPLFSRNNTYNHFLAENKWVLNFMINCLSTQNRYLNPKESTWNKFLKTLIEFLKLENFARLAQKAYMRHPTKETISNNFLAFHPQDNRVSVLQKYKKVTDF